VSCGDDQSIPRRYEFNSGKDLKALFEKLRYTPESWGRGSRAVPRIYLTNIPARYRAVTAKQVSLATKKRLFLKLIAPLVLRSNELTMAARKRVFRLKKTFERRRRLRQGERRHLDELAAAYFLDAPVTDSDILPALQELLVRVDIVPLSIALAQAAEESAWGKSRFADEGNALFGQWTYGGIGITPEESRASKGNYKIAAFNSPLESAVAYMENLNTHRAYARFRALRAAQRRRGEKLNGEALLEGLSSYSERGADYVEGIKVIMRTNKLAAFDEAYLANGPDITLVPVGPGSE